MKNKELKFRTNINCGGCVKAVTPYLDKVDGILEWNVDTTDKNKILTVKSDGITQEEIIEIVKKAGFEIESIV